MKNQTALILRFNIWNIIPLWCFCIHKTFEGKQWIILLN